MKNTNMTFLLCLFFFTSLLFITYVGAIKEFKVGDREGWRQPAGQNQTSLYNRWAAGKRFHVGDSLRFEYKNDSVLVVDKFGFYHCNTSKPISSFNNGNSVINLEKPGPNYFISGDTDHCKNGQRLVVEVMTLHPISHTPPHPYLPVSPSPSPLSSSGVVLSASVTVLSVSIALVITALVTLA